MKIAYQVDNIAVGIPHWGILKLINLTKKKKKVMLTSSIPWLPETAKKRRERWRVSANTIFILHVDGK